MAENDSNTQFRDDGTSSRYRHLIEHVQDAVVEFQFVDDEPVIRTVNRAFVETFGHEYDDVRGESLNEVIVPEWLRAEARTLDRRTATGEVNYQRVKRETTSGLREFLYRGIPYDDETGATDGFAVYTDLTEITRHQRRVHVLNRILRHNLRNNANVITGNTTRLLEQFDEQTSQRTRVAATIESAARELEQLSREAANVSTVLSNYDADRGTIDCVSLIHDVVNQYRRTAPAAAIRTETPDSVLVAADANLRFAIESLVDNAITHNPAEQPTVRVGVTVDEAPGWVTLHVEDDGPPIPAADRSVVTGQVEITPTRHASGIGLWVVKWTAELFGGELSFDESELGGNDVRIRLPQP